MALNILAAAPDCQAGLRPQKAQLSERIRLSTSAQARASVHGPKQKNCGAGAGRPPPSQGGSNGNGGSSNGGGSGGGGRGGGGGGPEPSGGFVGGSASLLAAVSSHSFQKALKDALLCCGTFVLADFVIQVAQSGGMADLDFMRLARLAAFGLLIKGPAMSTFYSFIDSRLPGNTARRVLEKLMVDQTGWSWINNAAFLFALPVMEGRSLLDACERVKQEFPGLQRNAYMLWPAAHLVNYAFVPSAGRTLYVSLVSLTWTGICCFTSQQA